MPVLLIAKFLIIDHTSEIHLENLIQKRKSILGAIRRENFVFLAVIMHQFSRRLIGAEKIELFLVGL